MDLDLGRQSVAEWAEAAPDGEAATFQPAQQKYTLGAPIGKGGMGEVVLATDRDLRRQVAMKLLRKDAGGGRDQLLQFVAEAQATSQLEHPGIPPVHDIGTTGDGRPWFTMKLVRGRTFREIFHDLRLGRKEVEREYTLHRLVSILERICEALHFAHERGVLHRDIKPDNVMLGDYGEVHVMDWGLAKVGGETGAIDTARVESGLETQYGALKGTLPYMSPEQMLGETDLLDPRTDIYALGCLLYEALTLHPAFDPSDPALLTKKLAEEVPDVAERSSDRLVPEALAEICRKAMAKEREKRFNNANELREALRRWLDGRAERERRHREAEKLAGQGQEAAAKYERLKADVSKAEDAAEAEAAKYKPWQPVAEKRSMIEARQRVETLKTEVALAFAETTHLLNAALMQEADNATARTALARLWQRRLTDAERRGAQADVAHALTMVRRHDDGTLAAFVKGDGSLALASDPPGAEVWLYRYVECDAVLRPEEERHLGQTPLGPVSLPMGSYLCILKKEGFRDVRYPVHISRNRAWQGTVKLRTDAEIGEGFVYVPAGPFVYGEGKDAQIRELPDFAIARYPVTFEEYAEFLQALDEKEAEERLPRSKGDGPYLERTEEGAYRTLPAIVEGAAREWCLECYGEGFDLRIPVMAVTFDDARAYCRWKSETTGQAWRLPTEKERAKAARGVDGRRFPWGDLQDASLGKCRESRAVNCQPEPVGAFPTAESVYGMGDAAGGMWDWIDSWFDAQKSLRVLRGGAWGVMPAYMRCASRGRIDPSTRYSNYGFRCARGL
ncbi:MAG: SUMF1/EgtB/PvdO family nonheme iron enzyme [Planctomycetota bacterium]|jgi:serine/threonine-protein kinase